MVLGEPSQENQPSINRQVYSLRRHPHRTGTWGVHKLAQIDTFTRYQLWPARLKLKTRPFTQKRRRALNRVLYIHRGTR